MTICIIASRPKLCLSPHPGNTILQELQLNSAVQLEVLGAGEEWVEVISSISETTSLPLSDCVAIASVSELIDTELRENWQRLRHYASPALLKQTSLESLASTNEEPRSIDQNNGLKRSVDCRERSCEDKKTSEETVNGDEWFKQYVSYPRGCIICQF